MLCGTFLCGDSMSVYDNDDPSTRLQGTPAIESLTNTDHREQKLCTILNDLHLEQKDQLFTALKSMHDSSHVYHFQWRELDVRNGLIEKSYDLVRRYEANGLQLDGYGCWLFEKILVSAKHRISDCTRYAPSDILELILRIMLEHKTYLTCKTILTEVIMDSPPFFELFCRIGIKIADELPQPISFGNFSALFHFIILHLRSPVFSDYASVAFHMLQLIAARVESSARSQYFITEAADVLRNYLENSEPSIASTLYDLLRRMLPLKHGHMFEFRTAGFFSIAIAYVKKFLRPIAVAEENGQPDAPRSTSQCEAAMRFLSHAVSNSAVLQDILTDIPLGHFVALLSRVDDQPLAEAAVCLFAASHGNTLAEHSPPGGAAVDFVTALMDRAVELLKENRDPIDPSAVVALCRPFRYLARSEWAVSCVMSESLSARRATLIALIQKLLEPEREDVGEPYNAEVYGAALIDVLSVLSGWVDVCLRGFPGRDEAIEQLLSSTTDKAIYATTVDEVALNSPSQCLPNSSACASSEEQSSLINALLPVPIMDSDQHIPVHINHCNEGSGDTEVLVTEKSLADENVRLKPLGDHLASDINLPPVVAREVRISRVRLTDFVTEWEIDSPREVCEKVFAFVGISRSQPSLPSGTALMSVEGMNVEQLAEVLVELIVDERHGVCDVAGAMEKCIQLITDVAEIGDAPCSVALGAIDSILDTISYWDNMTDSFLMQTCLSALIVFADRQSSCRKLITNSFDKIDAMLLRVGSPVFLFVAIKLCHSVMSAINKLPLDGESIVVNWVMRSINTGWTPLVTAACQLLVELSSANRPLLFKGFSRRELELPMIQLLKNSNDISIVLVALRTLALSAANFNERPFWFFDSWSLPLLSSIENVRELRSVDFMYTLLETEKKFGTPHDLVILSYGLTILTYLEEVPSIRDSEVHTLKFQSIFVPELAKLLSVVSQAHRYISTNHMHHPVDADVPTVEFEEMIYGSLLSCELHGLNSSFELMCAAAMQTLHALVTYGDVLELSLYEQYEEEFRATPICEAVLYMMIQLPHNYNVQSKGIDVVQKFVANGYGLRIYGECCSKVLVGSMVAFSDDSGIHRAFCSIVYNLAKRSEHERIRLVRSAVFKWLYVVIRAGSPENAPLACKAVSMIADIEERAEVMGNAGLMRTVVLLLDKHISILKVQVEGLRTIVTLCKSQVCFRQLKAIGGVKKVKRAREFLRSILVGWNDGHPHPILDQSPYVGNDLVQLLDMSSPPKLGEKCAIS